jgi:ketosteroid isomerase-like protein
MRTLTKAALGAAAIALAACKGAPAPLSDADRAAILASDSAFAAAVNAGSVDGMTAGYTADAVVLPADMPEARGTDAIRQLFTGLNSAGRYTFQTTSTGIDGAGDIAWHTGTYHLELTPADATQPKPPAEDGKWLVVLRRQADGSWKTVADQWNRNSPAPAPPAAAPARRR